MSGRAARGSVVVLVAVVALLIAPIGAWTPGGARAILRGPTPGDAGPLDRNVPGSPTRPSATSSGEARPSVVTPGPNWTNLSASLSTEPPAGYGWEATYDNATASVIAFGECPYSLGTPCQNETWSYNASYGWLELGSGAAPAPSARQGPAMAYDPLLGAVVLFGGDRQGSILADTWEWSRAGWTDISGSLATTPPSRFDGAMAWDPSVSALVLTGGAGCSVRCTDTWEFNGHWTKVNTSTSAPGLAYAGLTYDAAAGELLEVSGQSGTIVHRAYAPTNGTWEFNGTDWIQLHPSVAPPAESVVSMAYDPVAGVLVYVPSFTGATWIYRAGNWTNITATLSNAPSQRSYPGMAMDDADGYVLLFGGALSTSPGSVGGAQGSCGSTYTACANDTWAWFAGSSGTPYPTLAVSAKRADAHETLHFGVTSVFGGTAPYTFQWRFGDGTSASTANTTHAYATAHLYTATLMATDALGNTSNTSVRIDVNADPRVGASASPTVSDVGFPFDFQANLSDGLPPFNETWSFDDGSYAYGLSASHAYAAARHYLVRFRLTDAAGEVATANLSIRVEPTLSVVVTDGNLSSPDLGELVNFSAHVTGGTPPFEFAWQFGDGGIGGDLPNISHIFTTNGPFTASVSVTDAVGAVERSTISLKILLNVSILGSGVFGAAPFALGFESTVVGGSAGYSYDWSFGDGGTSTSPDPQHTYGQPGRYVATLAVMDRAGDFGSASWAVTVAAGGGPLTVTLQPTAPDIPLGGAETVTARISGGEGLYTLQWTGAPAGCSSEGVEGLLCRPTVTGTYPVTLVVTDASGDRASASTNFSVGGTASASPPPLGALSVPMLVGVLGIGAAIGMAFVVLARRRPPRASGAD